MSVGHFCLASIGKNMSLELPKICIFEKYQHAPSWKSWLYLSFVAAGGKYRSEACTGNSVYTPYRPLLGYPGTTIGDIIYIIRLSLPHTREKKSEPFLISVIFLHSKCTNVYKKCFLWFYKNWGRSSYACTQIVNGLQMVWRIWSPITQGGVKNQSWWWEYWRLS